MLENVKVLVDSNTLQERIEEIAEHISNDYNGEDIVMVCVLKGAVYFAIDLSKKIKNSDVIMDFVKVSSYGVNQRESTGTINFKLGIS